MMGERNSCAVASTQEQLKKLEEEGNFFPGWKRSYMPGGKKRPPGDYAKEKWRRCAIECY
jgi:hypothetical protein